MVELLVEVGGMAVDMPTREGRALDTDLGQTPLVLAARGGHVKTVESLLIAGADVETRYKGRTGECKVLGSTMWRATDEQTL